VKYMFVVYAPCVGNCECMVLLLCVVYVFGACMCSGFAVRCWLVVKSMVFACYL
jgi:hypothetical protein